MIPEAEIAGSPRKFGRLVQHDPRSRAFRVSRGAGVAPKTVAWPNKAPVLDQGELGSCTGHAMAHWENSMRAVEGVSDWLGNSEALELYSEATSIDEYPGKYPPEDTGSSGLAVAKAAVNQGYISAYRHAFGLLDTLTALQSSPVIIGSLWFQGMNEPDKVGFLRVMGESLGGHQYALLGCDVENEYVTVLNSWSADWGDNGTAKLLFTDLSTLLDAQGDVTVPIN